MSHPITPADLHESLASVELLAVERVSPDHGPISLRVAVLGPPDGPLMLCVHGWPENWYSWRHQMTRFAALGVRVAAMDVRGYGGSTRPTEIAAYRLTKPANLSPYEYFGIPFAFVLGWLFFDEAPFDKLIPGVFFIVAGGLIIAWRVRRQRKAPAGPTPAE